MRYLKIGQEIRINGKLVTVWKISPKTVTVIVARTGKVEEIKL